MKYILLTLFLSLTSPGFANSHENLPDRMNTAEFITRGLELSSDGAGCDAVHNFGTMEISTCMVEFLDLYKKFVDGDKQDRTLETALIHKNFQVMHILSLGGYPELTAEFDLNQIEDNLENSFVIYGASERETCNATCSREFINEVRSNATREVEKGNVRGALIEIINPKEPLERANTCYKKCASQ